MILGAASARGRSRSRAAPCSAIAVPILTLLIRPENRGGYNPEYSSDRIAVHWVAVAGITLLMLALARELSRARARPGSSPSRSAQRRRPATHQHLDRHVAREPRQLGELARRVAQRPAGRTPRRSYSASEPVRPT